MVGVGEGSGDGVVWSMRVGVFDAVAVWNGTSVPWLVFVGMGSWIGWGLHAVKTTVIPSSIARTT
jgi:hypothetical protein